MILRQYLRKQLLPIQRCIAFKIHVQMNNCLTGSASSYIRERMYFFISPYMASDLFALSTKGVLVVFPIPGILSETMKLYQSFILELISMQSAT